MIARVCLHLFFLCRIRLVKCISGPHLSVWRLTEGHFESHVLCSACLFFSSEVPVTSHHLNPMSLTVAAYCLTNVSIRRRRWCGIVIDGYNWSVSFLDHDSLLVLAIVLGYKTVFNDWSNRRHGMYVHWNCLPIYSKLRLVTTFSHCAGHSDVSSSTS